MTYIFYKKDSWQILITFLQSLYSIQQEDFFFQQIDRLLILCKYLINPEQKVKFKRNLIKGLNDRVWQNIKSNFVVEQKILDKFQQVTKKN